MNAQLLKYTPSFLYYLIVNPKICFEYLIKNKKSDEHLGIAVATGTFASFFYLIANAIAYKKKFILNFLGYNTFSYLLSFWGEVFFISALWYFILNFFENKKVQGVVLIKTIFLSYYPLLFAPIFAIISLLISPKNSQFFTFFKILFLLSVLYLKIFVLKKLFNINSVKAIVLYILPILGVYAFIIIKIGTLISSLVFSLI